MNTFNYIYTFNYQHTAIRPSQSQMQYIFNATITTQSVISLITVRVGVSDYTRCPNKQPTNTNKRAVSFYTQHVFSGQVGF